MLCRSKAITQTKVEFGSRLVIANVPSPLSLYSSSPSSLKEDVHIHTHTHIIIISGKSLKHGRQQQIKKIECKKEVQVTRLDTK